MVPDPMEQTIKSGDRPSVFKRPGTRRTRSGTGSADEKDVRPQGGALGMAAFLNKRC